ncbi:hypothetical protein L1987_29634 [Smallanthus sonchifolius]|uniref:Uncharacterized protein n=1 Tax=Smallanthus sonchifolius TaxID=185202 RepID=A0ACB9I154_9ASTR|nr:hypothetical protein L1987_29634 [Smallanthus sonchifolius]
MKVFFSQLAFVFVINEEIFEFLLDDFQLCFTGSQLPMKPSEQFTKQIPIRNLSQNIQTRSMLYLDASSSRSCNLRSLLLLETI